MSLFFYQRPLQKKIKNFVDEIVKLPIRYHKKLLPVPQIKIDKHLSTINVSKHLKNFITNCLKLGRRCLIFAPSIATAENLSSTLNNNGFICNFVHSEDKERNTKINDFRTRKINVLITTTILERGVTFDYLDVLVFKADHEHFTKECLVQIAGRVGRKHYDSTGSIIFLAKDITQPMKNAIKDIKYMNNLAIYRKLTEEVL